MNKGTQKIHSYWESYTVTKKLQRGDTIKSSNSLIEYTDEIDPLLEALFRCINQLFSGNTLCGRKTTGV